MTRILVIDNYDSFTYNLADGLGRAGADVQVHRNDAIDRDAIAASTPDGLVLSPGPGSPANEKDFGVCRDLITKPLEVPMLGVCLGMQGMALHTGGSVGAAPELVHGEASPLHLGTHPLFDGMPRPTPVARYHSLCVTDAPGWQHLGEVDGTLMAMAHPKRPWMGVQFHPESILSPAGQTLLENFVRMCT